MTDEFATWLGGGLALVILYILVSNTLWLIFGSRVVQSLPGVKINGFKGTLKIAAMLVLSLIGVAYWSIKFGFASILGQKPKPVLTEEVGKTIQKGARLLRKRGTR